VHRFNKSQQDAFLPHVESGLFTFIGATTENPSFEVNSALLSRCQVYVLKKPIPDLGWAWRLHIVKNDNLFIEEINNMVNRPLNKNNKIRIATFPNNIDNYFDLTKNVCWFFLGVIFGGFEEELLLFSKLMRETSIQFIHNHKSFIWEVNLWYIIYLQNKELFDCYYCNNHDIKMIQNY
jgi:hypothetical protein